MPVVLILPLSHAQDSNEFERELQSLEMHEQSALKQIEALDTTDKSTPNADDLLTDTVQLTNAAPKRLEQAPEEKRFKEKTRRIRSR